MILLLFQFQTQQIKDINQIVTTCIQQAFDAINGNGGLPAVLNSTYKDQVVNNIPELICAMTPDYSTIGFEGVDVSYWWYSIWSETEFGTEVYYSLDFWNNMDAY